MFRLVLGGARPHGDKKIYPALQQSPGHSWGMSPVPATWRMEMMLCLAMINMNTLDPVSVLMVSIKVDTRLLHLACVGTYWPRIPARQWSEAWLLLPGTCSITRSGAL